MAIYGRTYRYDMYDHMTIEAESEQEAEKLFEQMENSWRYRFDVLRMFLGESDARDECGYPLSIAEGLWEGPEYGYDEATVNPGNYKED